MPHDGRSKHELEPHDEPLEYEQQQAPVRFSAIACAELSAIPARAQLLITFYEIVLATATIYPKQDGEKYFSLNGLVCVVIC